MKKILIMALVATAAWSVDYSQMSTEELVQLRGTLSASERPAFKAEMQKRMRSMSAEDRQQLMKGRGKGKGMRRGQKGM